jgi:L-ascorbate metabolism protein UlaG (beta-lactamase superfamily)
MVSDHAGDTCAFGDMQLIRELYAPDISMLPIGDFYTMGPKGAALCAFAGREVCHFSPNWPSGPCRCAFLT